MPIDFFQILRILLPVLIIFSCRALSASAGTLLLVCPAEWQSALTDYASLRRSQGMNVEFLFPAAPRCKTIHYQICCHFWKQSPSGGHLLLIGDSNWIPHFSENIPSDLPYCYMDGPGDHLPDWSCSRIPVSSPGELKQYLGRLPVNRNIPTEQLLIDTEDLFDSTLELPPPAPFSAIIQFAPNSDSYSRRLFLQEWQTVLSLNSGMTCGELLHQTCLGLYSQLPLFQVKQLLQTIRCNGDSSLIPKAAGTHSPAPLSARRSLSCRHASSNRNLQITVHLQIFSKAEDFLLVREELPYGWVVDSVRRNHQEIQYVQDRRILKFLIQSQNSTCHHLAYHLSGPVFPGELYSIRGNIQRDGILCDIDGISVLEYHQPRHVLETPLTPGWNLLCFSAWLSPEAYHAYPEERFFQLDTAARCWIQCSLETLQPEQGFWLFHQNNSPIVRQWLADGADPMPAPAGRGWELKQSTSVKSRQWIWKDNQYQQLLQPSEPFQGSWQLKQ